MKFVLTSSFGALEEIRNGKAHNGIDLAMPIGTEVRSIADAVVERVVDYGSKNIGKGVILKLEDGTRAIYGHMSEVNVEVGQKLSMGDTLGFSRSTGHSPGPHPHFGLYDPEKGEYIDPSPLAEKLAEISGPLDWMEGSGAYLG